MALSAPFMSTKTTNTVATESDHTGATTKKTETTAKEITTPSQTNQYEHAAWKVQPNGRATLLSLQPAGVSALYLALYRVTNDDDSNPVTIQTDVLHISLAPGTSVDISTLEITIVGGSDGAHGSYQNLCCSLAQQQVQPPKGGAGDSKSAGAGAGAGGGNGGGNGGPAGGGPAPGGGDSSGGSLGFDPTGGSDTGGSLTF